MIVGNRCVDGVVASLYLITLTTLFISALCAGQRSTKLFMSPDSILIARVTSIDWSQNGNRESRVEIRTIRDSLLGYEDFTSKDHQHGLGILNAAWTADANFFVFSTISSGGRNPGHFPTYYYDRNQNRIILLDRAMNLWIMDPEFYLDPDDIVLVRGRDVLPNETLGDTLSRAAHLTGLSK